MNPMLTFITGLVIGAALTWAFLKKAKEGDTKMMTGEVENKLISKQITEKEDNKQRILGFMESGNQPLTNSHVRQMLDIPESTATRYFEELEQEGKIKQVGATGAYVYYELAQ